MATHRSLLAALVLVAVPLAGCVGFGGPEAACSAQHAYADRLVFQQSDLFEALGDAAREANASNSASWDRQQQGTWNGTRGVVETVRVDGRVHGNYEAAPGAPPAQLVQDSAVAAYGSLALDRVTWAPNGSEDDEITYTAPPTPGDPHRLAMTFRTSNTTEDEAAGYVRTLHEALFPHHAYEPTDDPSFSRAWLGTYEIAPPGPVHADGLLTSLIDDGDLQARQAPFADLVFPHTLGTVHVQDEDVGPYEGTIALRLSHDVRTVAVGTDPTIVLEATPGDRGYVSNLGSAALGPDELRQTADERLSGIDGLPELPLETASYEDGGQGTVPSGTACTPMNALGEPLIAPS